MKKTFVFLGLVIVVLCLFVNAKLGNQEDINLSDNELVEAYLLEERGNGDYEIFVNEGPDKDCIYFIAYEDGIYVDCGSVERNYCKSIATNQE